MSHQILESLLGNIKRRETWHLEHRDRFVARGFFGNAQLARGVLIGLNYTRKEVELALAYTPAEQPCPPPVDQSALLAEKQESQRLREEIARLRDDLGHQLKRHSTLQDALIESQDHALHLAAATQELRNRLQRQKKGGRK